MQVYFRYIPYALIIVLVCLLLFSVNSCNHQKDVVQDMKAQMQFKDQTISTFTNKLDQVITESRVAQTSSQETVKELSKQIFQLKDKDERRIKEIQSLTRIVQQAGISHITIDYKDIPIGKDSTFYIDKDYVHKDSVVIPPRKFDSTNKYFTIQGTVLLKGVAIDSISFPDSLAYRIATERPKGFFNRIFKSNYPVVQAVHTNPYYTTKGLNTITVKQKPSAWHRWIFPTVVGLGTLIITTQLSP